MQLKTIVWWLCCVPLLLKSGKAAAQESRVKIKKLRYDEGSPGIVVDEESIEAVIELDNLDKINMLYLHDAITGASPTGIEQSTDAVTTASGTTYSGGSSKGRNQVFGNFEDERNSYTLGYKKYISSDFSVHGDLNYSKENDYESKGISLDTEILFNQKNTTLAFNIRQNNDVITVKDGSDDALKNKQVNSLGASLSQLFGQRLVAGFGLSYGFSKGFHTDDYKKVKVGTEEVAESRPDNRSYLAYNGDVKYQFADNHSIRLILNKYDDSWKISSSTLDLQTMHRFTDSFMLSLYGRWYIQSAAYFWDTSFEAGNNDDYRTSDVRMSSFSSNTLSTTLYYLITEQLMLEASYGEYKQYEGNPSIFANASSSRMSSNYSSEEEGEEYEEEEEEGRGVLGTSGKKIITSAKIFSLAIEYRF